jgi:hypothetical protein
MLTFVMATEDFPFCVDVRDTLEKAIPIFGFPSAVVLADSGNSKGSIIPVRHLRCRVNADGMELIEIPRRDSICLEGDCYFILSGIGTISGFNLLGDIFANQVYKKRNPQPGCQFRLIRLFQGGVLSLDEKYRAR